ncbi:MAG: glycosyltransferase family 39 protein [Anaerolineaceae bacterium]|nr:glycosyltransferase family 39 protein [Anaerolineaceae bacterium]
MLRSKSAPASVFWWVVEFSLIILITILSVLLDYSTFMKPRASLAAVYRHPTTCVLLFGYMGISFLSLLITPSGAGRWLPYYQRLEPLIWFNALHALVLCAAAGFNRGIHRSTKRFPRFIDRLLTILLPILVIAYFGLTRLGVPTSLFASNISMPLTILQASLILILFSTFTALAPKFTLPKWQMFLVLWIFSALLWCLTEETINLYSINSDQPGSVFYPFSDAERYDLSGRYLQIGQAWWNGRFPVTKSLYLSFLYFLQALTRADFTALKMLHAAVLAVWPPLVYLLVDEIFDARAGLLSALLISFKARNTIAGSLAIWHTVHPLEINSEIPMGIILTLYLYFFVRWLKQPGNKTRLLLAGAVLGLAVFIRDNAWLLVPTLPIAILWAYWKQWKQILINGALFSIIMLAAIFGWSLRSILHQQSPFFFLDNFTYIILERRYSESPPITPPTETAAEPIQQDVMDHLEEGDHIFLQHFSRNFYSSIHVLPANWRVEPLDETLNQPPFSGAQAYSISSISLIYLELVVLFIGIIAACRRSKATSWVPMLAFVLYNAALAVARTSAGRYIVTIDWVILVYFAIGITAILQRFWSWFGVQIASPSATPLLSAKVSPGWQPYLVIVGCLIIGLIPFLVEQFAPKAPVFAKNEALLPLTIEHFSDQAATEAFLLQDQAIILEGIAYYPRWVEAGSEYEQEFFKPITSGRSGMVLRLIGDYNERWIFFPSPEPIDAIENETPVTVWGCVRPEIWSIDALQIMVGNDLLNPHPSLDCETIPSTPE